MDLNNRRRALGAMLVLPLGIATAARAEAKPKGTSDMMADQLDRMVSRDQITELLYSYARSNDRVDEELLRACFWPESTHKHGGFDGTSTDFINFALKIIRGVKYTAHHISNVSVDVNGDRAFSECYYFAHHRRATKGGGGEEDAFFEGRYLDQHERRDGVWKIIRRRGLSDYSNVVPATTLFASWPSGQHSLRHPDDEYYVMRQQVLCNR